MAKKLGLIDYAVLAVLIVLIVIPDPTDLMFAGVPVVNILMLFAYYWLKLRGKLE